jgi:Glycine zipper 2TM domain
MGLWRTIMTTRLLAAALSTAVLCGCATYDDGRSRNSNEWGYYDRNYYQQYGQYDWDRPDPRDNGYYAERYYRNNPRYRERRLADNDRIYRGRDGKYYCRRSDGTTGLIVGAIAGGVLANVIVEGRSETLATVLGALGGAVVGRQIDRNNVRCR